MAMLKKRKSGSHSVEWSLFVSFSARLVAIG